jgi:EAL domain-containing protein (putative c-di-GMP-specific phosphodiesterase class I)/GGDEF domain-containing protein
VAEVFPPTDQLAIQTRLLQYRASLYDPDTGLPTMPLVLEQVRRMLDERDMVAVLLVRLEQERELETILGWERYDHMLQVVARFLKSAVDRLGPRAALLCQESVRGDTFLVFVAEPVRVAGLAGELVGGPEVESGDGDEREQVALRIGHGTIRRRLSQRLERCIYRGVLEARLDFHRRGEALDEARRGELRLILERGDISTLFQPIVELPHQTVIGVEALSRGPHGSYLEPAENLFGFTERAGMLGEIEQLCVDRALVNADTLPREIALFLNLSIHGLDFIESGDRGLADRVRRAGFSPERVVLEITERTYAESPERLRETVGRLRGQGFRIAIDDMGTGYSSLHILADLHPDYIKLDHMLVRDLSREPIKQNLVSAIIGFAHTSNSLVIAEGVETADEVQILEGLGVTLQQGYFFGIPRPA